ncbi:MAG: hypothetical protein KBF93_01085 [Leptospiraceae bacterium]|nr:hypothetical protein [Leptospiraceae bacterium]
MKVVIILILFIFSCSVKKGVNQANVFALLGADGDFMAAYFSYPGRYTDPEKKEEVMNTILSIIKNAKFSLKVYAYSLNNSLIIQELKEAKNRGVNVEVVGDKEQNYDLLQESGFTVNVWKQSGLHHIKVIYADNEVFFTGTGNFSKHGLTHDWNGYISFIVEPKNRNQMQEFLDEKLTTPVFSTNGIDFISSPENGFLSQNLLLRKIEEAQVSIDYLIFDHFDPVLTHALKKASSRGVQVTGVYDSPVDDEGEYLANEFYGISSNIYKDGNEDILETLRFPEGGLLHHKSMVIDGKILLSGSYNYSANSRDSNREILFITENYKLVTEFQNEFIRVRDRSYVVLKKRFYTNPNHVQLNSGFVNKDTICLPQNVDSPMIQVGSGIWTTFLYYPRIQNTNCIPISTYASISSGFTKATRADFFSIDSFFDTFQVYDRNSNFIYSYQVSNPNPVFHSGKKNLIKKPWYFRFTSTRIFFEMPEDLSIVGKDIQVWIPGREIRHAKVEQDLTIRSGYSALIPTLSSERSYAAIFIDSPEVTYFFCYQDRERSGKAAFEFISKEIYLQSRDRNHLELECIKN